MSSPAEGVIRIELSAETGKGAVRIENSRALAITNGFIGRKPAEAAGHVPLVFPICRAAQAAACAEAIENALGIRASSRAKAVRALLVLGETAREHTLQVLRSWPHCLNATEPAMASPSIKRLLFLDREVSDALQDANSIDSARLDHAVSELTAVLGEAVFGELPEEWLSRRDIEDLAFWARRNETLAQTIFEYLVQTGMASAGAAEIAPLPQIQPSDLQHVLLGENADTFAARPQWDGLPRETTPLSRLINNSLIESIKDKHGYGLLARLTACLLELAKIPGQMSALAASLEQEQDEHAANGVRDHGAGVGFAEGARGRLAHAVEIADGVIRRYRVLAPAEWNFHPQGAAARGLADIAVSPPGRRAALARLFITAVDPCASYELSLA